MFENDNHFRRVGNKVFEGDSLKSLYDHAEKYGYYIDSTDNSSEGKDLEYYSKSNGYRLLIIEVDELEPHFTLSRESVQHIIRPNKCIPKNGDDLHVYTKLSTRFTDHKSIVFGMISKPKTFSSNINKTLNITSDQIYMDNGFVNIFINDTENRFRYNDKMCYVILVDMMYDTRKDALIKLLSAR